MKAALRNRNSGMAAAMAVMIVLSSAAPQSESDAAPATADADLLEDLGPDLFDEPSTDDDGNPAQGDLDDRLTKELADSAGEDVGAGQGESAQREWLRNVTQRMRHAESVLSARDITGQASNTQRQVVTELDVMIEKLRKQCQKCGGQCNKPPSPQDKPPKPSAKPAGKPGETTAELTASVAPPDRKRLDKLVKDLWGRLPQRQRDEILQPLSEDFVPEYASEIEAYFRSLANPSDDSEQR